MNATSISPAAYNAMLVEHRPLVRKMAHFYCAKHPANGDPEDFAQDLCEMALVRATNYRTNYLFATWIRYLSKAVAYTRKQKAAAKSRSGRSVEVPETLATPASQHDYAELSQVLRHVAGRGGEALVRVAMGDRLEDVGADMGISKERVRQITNVERRRLVQSLNTVRLVA